MLVGAIIRNIMDVQNKEIPMEEISTLGGASLSVFLGLAMIDMKLWQLAELAVPMVVMLLAQTVLMFFYANFVVFNVLGKSYDAAVMTSGFCGFGMGATRTLWQTCRQSPAYMVRLRLHSWLFRW